MASSKEVFTSGKRGGGGYIAGFTYPMGGNNGGGVLGCWGNTLAEEVVVAFLANPVFWLAVKRGAFRTAFAKTLLSGRGFFCVGLIWVDSSWEISS